MSALEPGRVVELAPGVRRVVAPNPGLLTGPGTNSYLLGRREKAVLDPGPDLSAHVDALVEAAEGLLRWILVTHTHTDHSPAAASLVAETGAEVIGLAAPAGPHQDPDFRPARQPADGEVLAFADMELEVLHTPGHASNHVCFLDRKTGWLFTGDHIINGSTVVIDPPDGDMGAYLRSLDKLARKHPAVIAPGHGDLLHRPAAAIERLVAHRLAREEKVLRALARQGESPLPGLLVEVYDDVDPSRHALAERSLVAHLEKLEGEGRVRREGESWRAAGG